MRGRVLALALVAWALVACSSEPTQPSSRDECCEQPAAKSDACACGEAQGARAQHGEGAEHASCAQGGACCEGSAHAQAGRVEPAQAGKDEAPEPAAKGPTYVTKGAEPLPPAEVGIGAVVADAPYQELGGREGTLLALAKSAPATVVLFTGKGCPVTKAYAPLLQELTEPWRKAGAKVLVVSPAVLDTDEGLRAWAKQYGWSFPVARDEGFRICDALGGRRTADAFVLDRAGVLRYRGPVDDRFGINVRRHEVKQHYLRDALEAVLAGRAVEAPALEAPGCKITRISFDDE